MVFHPQAALLATGDRQGQVTLWTLQGTMVNTWSTGSTGVADLAFSPDGTSLVTVSPEVEGLRWGLDGTLRGTFGSRGEYLTTVALHPDGTQLVTGGLDHRVRLWNLATNQLFWLILLLGNSTTHGFMLRPRGQILREHCPSQTSTTFLPHS